MANNIPITPGSGATIASDQAGDSSQVQLTKLAYAAAGSRTLIPADVNGLLTKVSSITDPVFVESNSPLEVDASGFSVPVINASGQKLAVSAPVDHPLFVQLSDGTDPIAGLPVAGTVTANQGLPAVVGNAHPVKVSDGVHTQDLTLVSGAYASKVDVIKSVDPSNVVQDLSAYVEGTDKTQVVGVVYNPTRNSLVGDNHASAARGTAYGDQQASLMDQGGVAVGTDANPLRTSPSSTAIAQTVQGAVEANLADNSGDPFTAVNPVPVQLQTGTRTRVTKRQSLIASTTAQDFWIPTISTKFVITKLLINVTVAGPLTVFDQTNAEAGIVTDGTYGAGNWVLDFSAEKWKSDTVNNRLRWTSGAGLTGTIVVHGYEEA